MKNIIVKNALRYFTKITIDKPSQSVYSKFLKDSIPKVTPAISDKLLSTNVIKNSEEFKHLTPEQIKLVESSLDKARQDFESLTKRMEKKRITKFIETAEEHGLPKKCPGSGFIIFMTEQLLSSTKDGKVEKITTVFKSVAEKWKALPMEEAKKYQDRCAAAKETFQVQMKDWATKQGLPHFKERSKLALYFCYKQGLTEV